MNPTIDTDTVEAFFSTLVTLFSDVIIPMWSILISLLSPLIQGGLLALFV